MKITPTDVSLSLILHSIDHLVLPEVESKGLRDQIGYIRLAVSDLLKRHGPLNEFLCSLLTEGFSLERAALLFLDGHSSHYQTSTHGVDFDDLWAQHATLTAQFQQICARLIIEKPEEPHTDSLLYRIAAWETKYYKQIQKLEPKPFGAVASATPKSTLPLSKDDVENLLTDAGTALEVYTLVRNPGGFSKQTYFATIRGQDNSKEEIVIRVADDAPLLDLNTFDLAREFDLLHRLHDLGFPCPKPIDLIYHPVTNKPYFLTMRKIPGSMMSAFVDAGSAKIDENVWYTLGELLAQLHSIPVDQFSEYINKYEGEEVIKMTTSKYYRRQLDVWSRYLKTRPHLESPIISWALHWLGKNVPHDDRQLVLVHSDFNIHNILAVDGNITGVVDWETSTFGCAEHDLAYVQPHVSKHMDWQRFVNHYIQHGGREIRTKDMPFYLAFQWTGLTIGANQLHASIYEGRNRDIRFIMCEQAFNSIFMGMILESTKPQDTSERCEDL